MSKDSLARCYQNNKERLQKKLMKMSTFFSRRKIKE